MSGVVVTVYGLMVFVPGLIGIGSSIALAGAGFLARVFAELEPVEGAVLAVALLMGAGFGLLVVVAGGYGLYRVTKRRRPATRSRSASEWHDPGQGGVGAMCGVCGGPVAFRPGEPAVVCGYCRSVVVASDSHARRLISIALGQAQVALLEHARAERRRLSAELVQKRQAAVVRAYASAGMLVLLALPVIAAAWVWRTLTPSIEEAMVRLADRFGGDFGAGLELPFAWLDAYWIGGTPFVLTETGTFQSRWSIEAVYHDRPVLVTATTSWSDRVAKRLALLLARPMERDASRVHASATAEWLRSRHVAISVDYAGVVVELHDAHQSRVDEQQLTELARAAYELAEIR